MKHKQGVGLHTRPRWPPSARLTLVCFVLVDVNRVEHLCTLQSDVRNHDTVEYNVVGPYGRECPCHSRYSHHHRNARRKPDSKKVASTPGIGGNTLVCFCPMGKRPAVSLLRCRKCFIEVTSIVAKGTGTKDWFT